MLHEQEKESLDAADDENEEQKEDESIKEYIFLIDRSGSMYNTIKLARQALVLFLYSLPDGSKFNICSYGSRQQFMFEERSVEYNDTNLQHAVAEVESFEADFGGTVIYEPLAKIFQRGKPADCETSHIFLLTDGAIWDVPKVVNLVASKCSMRQRVHTFGVGHGASEELIKQCAFKGFGHFYFIYNEEEIEERVVSALTKTRLNYQIMQSIQIFDENGEEIITPLRDEAQPLLEGSFVDLTYLLEDGQRAKSYRIEVLEPNSMSTESFEGRIMAVKSQSLISHATTSTFK